MEKRNKIIYWITTGLLSAMMLMAASMYILKYEEISQGFSTLGFPIYIVYPLAIAKALGIIAILTRKSKFLRELAYAGFFYTFILAFSAHIHAGDGKFTLSIIAMGLLISSYIFGKKVFVVN